jgi:lipopolysaccharide biosynthesis regulator YciM
MQEIISLEDGTRTEDEIYIIQCVVAKVSRLRNDEYNLMKVSLKNIAAKPSSELCFELGEYYMSKGDYQEAIIWFYNAAYETECLLNIHYAGDYALTKLAQCYKKLGNEEQNQAYLGLAQSWCDSNM